MTIPTRKGELRATSKGFSARIRIGDGRETYPLPFADRTLAEERCHALAEIADRLERANHLAEAPRLLEMAARARPGRAWDAILVGIDALCTEGGAEKIASGGPKTFRDVGEMWTSGDLARRYPDHVREKRTSNDDAERLEKYVYPVLEDVPIHDVTLDHCEQVMASIPDGKSAGTRKQIAQVTSRVLALAVYPLRLRSSNPIPKGWLPKAKARKAKECLYPEEDATLLQCERVPLLRRLVYGFLSREGMRTDECASLEWRDVDLDRGKVHLDENKTDEPRDWDLDPGVWEALAIWRASFCADAEPNDRVFVESGVPINVEHLADQLRRDLRAAGITRPQLFERSATRQPIRAHDLRSTFVTVALATGKTETWVSDRTGHKSSTQIAAYRRKARTWTGMQLGALAPLSTCIPELASRASAPQTAPWIHRTGGEIGRRSGFRFRRRKA